MNLCNIECEFHFGLFCTKKTCPDNRACLLQTYELQLQVQGNDFLGPE